MKPTWMSAVNELNKEQFAVPPGWNTPEEVAAELQCAVDRVPELLKQGLALGRFEKCIFPVWSDSRRMTQRITCYRQAPQEPEGAPATPVNTVVPQPSAPSKPGPVARQRTEAQLKLEVGRIQRALRAHPERPDSLHAKNCASTLSLVRMLRAQLTQG